MKLTQRLFELTATAIFTLLAVEVGAIPMAILYIIGCVLVHKYRKEIQEYIDKK